MKNRNCVVYAGMCVCFSPGVRVPILQLLNAWKFCIMDEKYKIENFIKMHSISKKLYLCLHLLYAVAGSFDMIQLQFDYEFT